MDLWISWEDEIQTTLFLNIIPVTSWSFHLVQQTQSLMIELLLILVQVVRWRRLSIHSHRHVRRRLVHTSLSGRVHSSSRRSYHARMRGVVRRISRVTTSRRHVVVLRWVCLRIVRRWRSTGRSIAWASSHRRIHVSWRIGPWFVKLLRTLIVITSFISSSLRSWSWIAVPIVAFVSRNWWNWFSLSWWLHHRSVVAYRRRKGPFTVHFRRWGADLRNLSWNLLRSIPWNYIFKLDSSLDLLFLSFWLTFFYIMIKFTQS